MLNQNQIDTISKIEFNKINKRGIAMRLLSSMKKIGIDASDCSHGCWAVAKNIVDGGLELSPETLKKELEKQFATKDIKDSPKNVRVNGKDMDDEGLEICRNTKITISERIRLLIKKGYSLTRISENIKSVKNPSRTITYARVKRVKINDAIKRFSKLENEDQLKSACENENFKVFGKVYKEALKNMELQQQQIDEIMQNQEIDEIMQNQEID